MSMAMHNTPTWSTQLHPAHARRAPPGPGPVLGAYPIRELATDTHGPLRAWLQAALHAPAGPSKCQGARLLARITHHEAHWAALTSEAFATQLKPLRAQLRIQGYTTELIAQAFAAVCVLVCRHRGFALHDVQKLAAWWMLGGRLVEMATGEGKTLTVFLCAATAALAGVPVHVLTANDYLAVRDANELQALYADLGLRVAAIQASSAPAERRLAYQHDVVHLTASEVAFDHLRDRASRAQSAPSPEPPLLRGLCMAIIDEADAILVDEACTPLILSQSVPGKQAEQAHRLTLYLARQLLKGRDFSVRQHTVELTAAGSLALQTLTATLNGPWRLQRHREEQVCLGLAALHAFHRDADYLVRDGDVHIVDGHTGRLAIGRVWSRGLHQMVALKEGLPAQAPNETLTETSYQRFFPRYHALAGLSGTLFEARAELLRVYGLPTLRVSLRQASLRRMGPTQMLPSRAAKWQAVVRSACAQAQAGRAVLIGTDTVADSEALSQALHATGAAHQLLNARHDGESGEAERAIVAAAGQPGAITVATHMAGRGTDIHLAPDVIARGGLHVINTHLNASGRIDRQLYGRAARQGLPGSCERILSWQDPALHEPCGARWLGVIAGLARALMPDKPSACAPEADTRAHAPPRATNRLAPWPARILIHWLCQHIQRSHEARSRAQRWAMRQSERQLARQLALAGRQDWT
jgi:preprotein translocase subunit SecA